jgi:transcriptional regulator with XRE-family HTH domain
MLLHKILLCNKIDKEDNKLANKVTRKIPSLPNTTKGRIKYLRIKRGERQEDLADNILNVSRVMYGYYENDNDKRNVPIEAIISLANYYKVSTDFLLCLTNVEHPDTSIVAISQKLGLGDEAVKVLLNKTENEKIISVINTLLNNENSGLLVLKHIKKYLFDLDKGTYQAMPNDLIKAYHGIVIPLDYEQMGLIYLAQVQEALKQLKDKSEENK